MSKLLIEFSSQEELVRWVKDNLPDGLAEPNGMIADLTDNSEDALFVIRARWEPAT